MLLGCPCHWIMRFRQRITLFSGHGKIRQDVQDVVTNIIQHGQQPECLTIPDGYPPRRPRTSRSAISSFSLLNSGLHRQHVTEIKYATGQRTAGSVSRYHFLGQIPTLGRPDHFCQRQPSACRFSAASVFFHHQFSPPSAFILPSIDAPILPYFAHRL